jgi:hypothetical protein
MRRSAQSWIGKSLFGKSRVGVSWLASLMVVTALSLSPSAAWAGGPTGTLLLTVARLDDKPYPEIAFFAEFSVALDSNTAPTIVDNGVTVTIFLDGEPAGSFTLEQ